MYNLYKIIKDLCDANGISVAKMSRDIEIHRNVMGNLKAGRTKTLSLETLEKLSSYFKVPVTYFLDLGDPDQNDIPPEPPISQSQLLFALYGEVPEEIEKEDLEEIRQYANMVLLRKQSEKKGEYVD